MLLPCIALVIFASRSVLAIPVESTMSGDLCSVQEIQDYAANVIEIVRQTAESTLSIPSDQRTYENL